MKKALKIFGILFLLIIITAVAAPVIFKDKFKQIIKDTINENVNAQVDFSDVDISLISSFPKASLQIENLSVINFEPFKGDTLFYAKEIALKMPLSGLTSSDQIDINSFTIDRALVNIISNEEGVTNYDIAKKDDTQPTTPTESSSSNDFSFSVEEYGITNSAINYIDKVSKINIGLSDFNHSGSGDLSAIKSTLKTNTTSDISLVMDEANYLNNNKLSLDADIEIDQKTNTYTFLENTFKLNQLALIFDGYFKQHEDNSELDLKFNTPTSDFKNFIALLPEQYAKDINNIKTKGSFKIDGFAKGFISEHTIPKFKVSVSSENASFKYPDLPKSVENINLIAALANTTGYTKDIYLDIDKLSLQIDKDVFDAKANIKQLTGDALVDARLNGVLNLGNLSKAYPIQLENELKGILNANLHTSFSNSALENSKYEQIKNNGNFSITDFEFASKDIVNPISISEAKVGFTPQKVTLEKFDAKSGSSDFNATGSIDNLFGFLFSDKKLKGDFNVNSNRFDISDFMVDNTSEEENTQKESEEGDALKIPEFLDAKISADAKTVIYDNLTLKNVTGDLIIKDETAALKGLKTNMFDGMMAIDGNISTKNETPTFALDLGIDKFDISKSFKGMDLLTSLAPIAKILQGKLNTDLKLSGNLDNSFSPDLNSLTGNALAEILTTKISPEQSQAFSMLNNELSFIDLEKLDLKNLIAALSFENGKVTIKPFDVNYEDINIKIAGAHGFDQSLGYTATFDVPAKYFGDDVGGILAKLSDDDVKNIKVPVVANIGGSVLKPQIKTDLKQSVGNLTKQLIQVQKDKLLGQGSGAVKDVIGGLLGNGNDSSNEQTQDSTNNATNNNTSDPVKDAANDIIGGIFGNKKKKKDSTKQKN